MSYLLASPLKIMVSKNRGFILNLNNYRNTHYQTLNNAKIAYKAVMGEQINRLPFLDESIHITYTLYPKTRRRTDIGNVTSVHQKFFEDALVEFGKIKDDDYFHIIGSSQEFGEIDPQNPRVEVLIEEYTSILTDLH